MGKFENVLACLCALQNGETIREDIIKAAHKEVRKSLSKDRDIKFTWLRIMENRNKALHQGEQCDEG